MCVQCFLWWMNVACAVVGYGMSVTLHCASYICPCYDVLSCDYPLQVMAESQMLSETTSKKPRYTGQQSCE